MSSGTQLSLPWAWYTDPEIARLEHERIFRRAWQYVGRTDQVAEPGSYFASRAGDVPVVVTRDRAGELRALLNVCRHRGAVVAHGEGTRETLQCGYHAWTYALDGSLRAAPRADREPGFDGRDLALVEVAVGTWGPFVFVNPDAGAPPLIDVLGAVPDLIRSVGIEIERLRFHSRVEYALEANWKIACENYLECYHCAVAHPTFSELVDVSPDAYRLEADGLVFNQFGPLRDGRGAYAGGEVARSQFHFVWPNLKINIYPGRPNLSIGPVFPSGPGRSAGFLDYFFADDVDAAWIGELLAFDDQVGDEDRALVESVQRGVRAGMIEHGRLLPESERLIRHFQALVAAALA